MILLSPLTTGLEIAAPPHSSICSRAAAALDAGAVFVEPGFLSGSQLNKCREAVADLNMRCASKPGGVGADESYKLDAQVRASSVLDLNSDCVWPLLPAALSGVLHEIDSLRSDLAQATGRQLLENVELQLLTYARGGHYARHIDDCSGAVGTGRVHRSIVSSARILIPTLCGLLPSASTFACATAMRRP